MTSKDPDSIHVEGAHAHNLRNLDLKIPRNKLVAVTGPSGSGKSSLAFDTLFREGQRRYLETLSAHARRYAARMDRVDADQITGLSPAAAVGQRGVTPSTRSTAGTLSETYDYLRLLFGRLGKGRCHQCNTPLVSRTPDQICATISTRFFGETVTIAAPLVEDHKGSRTQMLQRLANQGFSNVIVNGKSLSLFPIPELGERKRHTIDLPCAIIRVKDASRNPLFEAVEKACLLGNGVVTVWHNDERERYTLSHGCPECGAPFPAIGPRLFSFNSAHGACPDCDGLGIAEEVSEDLLVADPNKTLREGALVPTLPSGYTIYSQVTVDVMNQICQAHDFSVDIPFSELTPEQRHVIFYGSQRLKVPFGKHSLESRMKWSGIKAKPREEGFYKGLIPVINEILKRDRNPNILRFVRSVPCEACEGTRLRKEARTVTLAGYSINELTAKPFDTLRNVLTRLKLEPRDAELAAAILQGLDRRLELMIRLGLGYLNMDRPSASLSGGEGRRMRLAREMSTDLRGMLYVLDEPSMGLHPVDKQRLLSVMQDLRDRGNSVLTVEHDPALLVASDHVLDLGPGAGKDGGSLLYNGSPDNLLQEADPSSATRRFLEGGLVLRHKLKKRPGNGHALKIRGARSHNLQGIDVDFPLGCFNLVTGVSGAGKSTLVNHVLATTLRNRLHHAKATEGEYDTISGHEHIDKVIHIDASPIGRTPRSSPATYVGVFDHIRTLFAKQPDAVARGFNKGHFSMNKESGHCKTCKGAGKILIGMHGLPDVTILCEECQGQRFKAEILEITYLDKNIHEILELTAIEALAFFQGHERIIRTLQAMVDVGLGYLSLGQSSLTLSGGEAQRMKLASELSRPATGQTLYILDEPTTGLHPVDVSVLLHALDTLVDKGNTVIAVEHHLDVMCASDYIVDLGPGSGDNGGKVVASGTSSAIAARRSSPTAKALARKDPAIPSRPAQIQPEQPIRLEGVTTHNLRGVHVSIPVQKLTVVTGLSGSGKTSLVFDTLFAECRRRYAESLSSHARRMLSSRAGGQSKATSGLFPAIAMGRQTGGYGERSTVATMTPIGDHLRILFSRMGPDHLTARHFSTNHRDGACPTCEGLGKCLEIDPDLLITDPTKSLWDGAMAGHKVGKFYGDPHGQYLATLKAVASHLSMDLHKPWQSLDAKARAAIMHGTGEHEYHVVWQFKRGTREGEHTFHGCWTGFASLISDEYRRKRGQKGAVHLLALMREIPCTHCAGSGLNNTARSVYINERNLQDVQALTILELQAFLQNQTHPVAREIYAGLKPILAALDHVGLGYLTSNRRAKTLSGGETQRVRLASQMGKNLVGVIYILDEPTHGLHAKDTDHLIKVLQELVAQGNTVVVVEHDATVIRAADHIIELGPGAGQQGGQLMVAGTQEEVASHDVSPTGRFLRGEIKLPGPLDIAEPQEYITILGAHCNNLKTVDVRIPLGALTVVEGVSGSGKSSLVFGTLATSSESGRPMHCKQIQGLDAFEGVVRFNQMPLDSGGTPLTYLKLLDPIQRIFAATETASAAGLKKSAFSFHSAAGRCPNCQGSGVEKTAMDFLEDVVLPCEICEGKRYNPTVLSILIRGKSIADILKMSVDEAQYFWQQEYKLVEGLKTLSDAGLGYLRLGQDTRTLSGGESQRLKLAGQLWQGRKQKGRCLYLLDEPTTGLHMADIALLLETLQALVKQGHTLVIVEHNEAIIAAANHRIELGPVGGPEGGYLL